MYDVYGDCFQPLAPVMAGIILNCQPLNLSKSFFKWSKFVSSLNCNCGCIIAICCNASDSVIAALYEGCQQQQLKCNGVLNMLHCTIYNSCCTCSLLMKVVLSRSLTLEKSKSIFLCHILASRVYKTITSFYYM